VATSLPTPYDPADEIDPARWLAETVTGCLGCIEQDGGNGTYYAADATENYCTGESVRLAAHAYGFPPEELAAASDLVSTP
jgi:hypothetical protein